MSTSTSPPRVPAALDETVAFAADISAKMRVPKRIKVTGEGDDEFEQRPALANGGGVQMSVPDRIVVLGGERHGAGGGAPRELLLERAAQPPAGDLWPAHELRVDEHLLPAPEQPPPPEESPERRGRGERSLVVRDSLSPPALVGHLSPAEELELLRRQLLKVNRRLMLIEVENQRRRSRELMLYTAGAAYFLVKVLVWMGRAL